MLTRSGDPGDLKLLGTAGLVFVILSERLHLWGEWEGRTALMGRAGGQVDISGTGVEIRPSVCMSDNICGVRVYLTKISPSLHHSACLPMRRVFPVAAVRLGIGDAV